MRKHSIFHFFKNKYFIISLIVIIIIAFIFYSKSKSSAQSLVYSKATVGNVIEQVSVTGTISPVDKADLAFEKSGVIASIFVKVGDNVKKGDRIASLDSAGDIAVLSSAQAQLAEISRGLRPEEFTAYQSAVDTASTALVNAKKDAVNAIHSSYVQAESAISDYSDSFFNNPRTVNPIINIRVESNSLQTAIDQGRLSVSDTLESLKNNAETATTSNVSDIVSSTESSLSKIKSFLNDLAGIVDDLSPGNSSISQQVIDTDMSKINTALSTLNQAITTISSADTELKNASSAYTQAENNFTLQKAGSSPDTIAVQSAKVAEAQAVLDEDTLRSPIDGIITKEDPNIGEFISVGKSSFSVQNSGFKIEAFVPEADIAKISIGDMASSTLDAYGSYVNFPAQVMGIDPAETILSGVPTYKVTLQFITLDSRIRSGMTANLEILTHSAMNVLEIPYRAITITSTSTTVRLVNPNNQTFKVIPVVTGLKGSDGTIQIISGLNEGDKVVTYVK